MNRLADQVTGPVLAPRDEGYDEERAGWQTARQHRPDLVVGAAGPADVQAAVTYASGRGLPVAVQGTGHASAAVAGEGGVLITTARMSAVRVDADAGTAWVAAGTRWDQVIHKAAPAGLAPLSGSAPHVGAVSYTLGGGLALLSRSFGYAADHVRGLDVVTADGRLRHVTRDCEPDLFWPCAPPAAMAPGPGPRYPASPAATLTTTCLASSYRDCWSSSIPSSMPGTAYCCRPLITSV
jgi:hypothetical protein